MGLDKNHPHGGFVWFTGVVEDRTSDPLKLGRVQVRIHGVHTEDKQVNEETGRGFLSKDLPWAFIMMPASSASMNGIGETPLGVVEGSHVVGFARDGRLLQDLIILGTIGGIPEIQPYTGDKPSKSEQEIGFQDPSEEAEISNRPRKFNKINNRDDGYENNKIPSGRYPQEKYLNEPDLNRLARAENLEDTYLEEKKTGRMRFSPTGEDSDDDKRIRQENLPAISGDWNENSSFYAADYPFNHVKETESGHVIELDDTPDAERIHIWHRYGNYIEFGPRGERQDKIIGDNFVVIMKDNKLFVKGNCDITAEGEVNILSTSGGINIQSNEKPITITSDSTIDITCPVTNFTGEVKVNDKKVLTV